MKNLYLVSAFFLGIVMYGQSSYTYDVDPNDIVNPERGFYHHTETHSPNYSFLNTETLQDYRSEENISLILRVFYLESFVNTPISQSFLNKMQTDFNTIRDAGVKVIIRFAYSNNDNNANPKDAPKSIILGHIQQLQPIIYANRDVINSLQVGFIGVYGEWYRSDNFGTGNDEDSLTTQNLLDRQEVLMAVLENFGWDIQIQVRTPKIKQNIFGTTPITEAQAYNLTVQKSRVGHYNDCFLADETDMGTFNNNAERTYLQSESRFTVNGGETCTQSEFSNCTNALLNLNRYSFDFLNIDYQEDVIDQFMDEGCFDEIKRRLGYRLELISSTLTPSTVTINLRNTGFGHLANERRSYIVYRNVETGNEFELQIDGDARLWVKGTTYTISQEVPLLPAGTYHLFLNLPDVHHDVMGLDQRYSVRFANQTTWETITGYNDLKLMMTVSPLTIQEFINDSYENYKVELFDMNGRRVTSSDVESLAKGIYIIRRTSSDGAVETRKIII
ncbi:MAG TPA: DUF4832 domain-containing protein [Flavobacterium sp.]|jgi:hypothetical protein